jgi:polyisoprenoid-binding protein YceI
MHSWTIDPAHSSVTFSVRHMMITNVRGEFQKVSGSATFDPAAPEKASVKASIDVASISTREAQRDVHLKSADFFDVEHHPSMDFVSRAVRPKGKGRIEIDGDLTIRGATKPMTLHVEGPTEEHTDPWGNRRIGASARTKIKRSDFGMVWNTVIEAGGVLVGDDVTIELDLSLLKDK